MLGMPSSTPERNKQDINVTINKLLEREMGVGGETEGAAELSQKYQNGSQNSAINLSEAHTKISEMFIALS